MPSWACGWAGRNSRPPWSMTSRPCASGSSCRSWWSSRPRWPRKARPWPSARPLPRARASWPKSMRTSSSCWWTCGAHACSASARWRWPSRRTPRPRPAKARPSHGSPWSRRPNSCRRRRHAKCPPPSSIPRTGWRAGSAGCWTCRCAMPCSTSSPARNRCCCRWPRPRWRTRWPGARCSSCCPAPSSCRARTRAASHCTRRAAWKTCAVRTPKRRCSGARSSSTWSRWSWTAALWSCSAARATRCRKAAPTPCSWPWAFWSGAGPTSPMCACARR